MTADSSTALLDTADTMINRALDQREAAVAGGDAPLVAQIERHLDRLVLARLIAEALEARRPDDHMREATFRNVTDEPAA